MPTAGKFWPGQATNAQRRKARQSIILPGVKVGIATKTQERYYYFAVSRLAPVLPEVASKADLDERLAEWVQCEFGKGTPLYLVGDSFRLAPSWTYTRRRLQKSWKLCPIWRRCEIPCRAPPLTRDIGLAMAGWCANESELAIGALILLGFQLPVTHRRILQIRHCDLLLEPLEGLLKRKCDDPWSLHARTCT